MESNQELKFESPSFTKRLKGMLGVDFYRLFHTPMFFIFLAIAAIIPAMVLGTTNMQPVTGISTSIQTNIGTTNIGQTIIPTESSIITNNNTTNNEEAEPLYTNTWQMIAADSPLYVVNSIAEYANMNMVFIFGGILVSIFIGHDYRSGYAKQLFTTHAKKRDYMMSKTLTCAFAMACMCITYLLGTVISGLLIQTSFEVNVCSLIIAIASKMVMSLGWASLYTFINVILRKYFGVSIVSSFFFGTGILIIGAAAILGNSSILNIFLYGSSVFACLSSNILTLVICTVVSVVWAIIYNVLGSIVLAKSDVY